MNDNHDLLFVDSEVKVMNQGDATRIYNSWGLQQRSVDRLLYCGITTLEHLEYMSPEDIGIIFKEDSQLGEKILFRKSLKNWREHNGFDEAPAAREEPTPPIQIHNPRRCSWESDSTFGPPRSKVKHADIRELLRSTHRGIKILNAYDKHCTLTNSEQGQLCCILVDYHMSKDTKMTGHQMATYAKDIVKAFPSELESTYYLRRGKPGKAGSRVQPQGKLFNRYCNESQKLRKTKRDNTPSD